MTIEVSPQQSQQVSISASQVVSGFATYDVTIPITIFGSVAIGSVTANASAVGSSGYVGLASVILRPASGTGRSSSGQVAVYYPAVFDSSLVSQLSDSTYFNSAFRLDDCWIDNANSRLVFRFRNNIGSNRLLNVRIIALVVP